MPTYTISPRLPKGGFDVHVIDSGGRHQTMLDFKTEVEAQTWIREDRDRGSINQTTVGAVIRRGKRAESPSQALSGTAR